MTSVVAVGSYRVKRVRRFVIAHGCAPFPEHALDDGDQQLLDLVSTDYTETLKRTPRALQFLQLRRLADPAVIDTFRLGFADRTLGKRLPKAETLVGGAIRGHLQRLGLMKPSGRELFEGSLVIPVLAENGRIDDVYGQRIMPKTARQAPSHIGLFNPSRGVFNRDAFSQHNEMILCPSFIDALTFWCAGFHNVTGIFGPNSFTAAYLDAFQQHGIKRAWLAFRNDEKGEHCARRIARELTAKEIECLRLFFPPNMDANALARWRVDVRHSLQTCLNWAKPIVPREAMRQR